MDTNSPRCPWCLFRLSTQPAEKFHIEIFRTGYDGGSNQWIEGRIERPGPFPARGPDEGYLIGARNHQVVNGGGDWICVKPEHWLFAGAGMQRGESVPGLIGPTNTTASATITGRWSSGATGRSPQATQAVSATGRSGTGGC